MVLRRIDPVPVFIGQAVAIGATLIPNFRVWNMRNLDTGQELQGQFEAVQPTENVKVNWEQHTSLNRGNAILQFINKDNETLSFDVRLYRDSITGDPLLGGAPLLGSGNPLGKLAVLKSWCEIDPAVRRPPILEFFIGDGHLPFTCVITGLSGIKYGRPDALGGFRDVVLTVDLLKFTTFSLEDEGATDTRYARAKDRDYYELLAFQEYGNPMLGDVIRKDHATQPLLAQGDTVKLPSIEGMRAKQTTQRSLQLKGGFGRKDTLQKALFQSYLGKHSGSYVSHVLQPSTTPVR